MVDFGLSEKFGKVFLCKKYVGKTAYKCPEIYAKKDVFDARSADCWSLGVVLFMMVCADVIFGVSATNHLCFEQTIGGAPYAKPCKDDPYFTHIAEGKLFHLLSLWDKLDMVTAASLDLLERMLQAEGRRLNIEEVQMHPWLL